MNDSNEYKQSYRQKELNNSKRNIISYRLCRYQWSYKLEKLKGNLTYDVEKTIIYSTIITELHYSPANDGSN